MAGVRARQVGLAYDTVPAGDDPDDYLDERQLAVKKWSRRLDTVWRQITSVIWVTIACVTIWYTNFFRVIWESPFVNRPVFYAGLCMLGFNMFLIFYFSVICETVKKLDKPWEEEYPDAIPVMCLCGIGTYVCFVVGFWDVWSWMTIFMVPIFFLGFISSGNLLPRGQLGTFLMFAIFFGAFFTSEYIPHEGLMHKAARGAARKY
jgi:hypothetical protein